MQIETRTKRGRKRRPEERPAPAPHALSYVLPDAVRITGLSVASLRRRAAEGKLRMFLCGHRRLVCGRSLRAMLGLEGGA